MKDVYFDWGKIDLHIHTDLSRKTKKDDYVGDFSVDVLISKLKENDVEIFSLTDHNILNLTAYQDYYEKCDSEADPLLLVGVELDIEVQGQDEVRVYHSLLIFNKSDYQGAQYVSDKLESIYDKKGIDPMDRVLTIEEIVNLFPEDDFFFIPHAGNTKSIVKSYKEDIESAQKMVLLMQSAFEKVPEQAKQKYNEGFNEVLEESFRHKDDHAYIEFSDNHNIGKYPCSNKGDDEKQHQFYYVKGGKSFETLRLAFIDPRSRIKSPDQYKDMLSSYNFIEAIDIPGDELLDPARIRFSPHLNVIVGGRSSGKSLFMSLLGAKIDSVDEDCAKYDKVDQDQVTLKTIYDSEFQQSSSIRRDEIVYLRQGDIVKYFEKNRLEDLARDSGISNEYYEKKRVFKDKKESLVHLVDEFVESYQSYAEEATKKYVIRGETSRHINSSKYVFLCNDEWLKEKYDEFTALKDNELRLSNLFEESGKLIDNSVIDIKEDEKEVVDSFLDLVKKKQAEVDYKLLRNEKRANLLERISEALETVNSNLDFEARQKNAALDEVENLKEDFRRRLQISARLKEMCEKIEKFDFRLEESVAVSDDVSLCLEVEEVGSQKITGFIEDCIGGYSNSLSLFSNILELGKSNRKIKNHSDVSGNSLKKKISKGFESIYDALENPRDFLKYSDGESSKNNSPGLNSEKYIQVILQNATSKIIVIDQPEDNLGNKFISEGLVDLIRSIKFKKQLFLITHSPSVVVYGDSENIILAHNNSNRISYEQVGLEDPDYQKEVCGILDGGEYVFDVRARKYNINRLLRK